VTVPTDRGFGPHNPNRTKNGRKEPVQPDKHKAVRIGQLQSLGQFAELPSALLNLSSGSIVI
jgi:hypothetical protein